MKALTLNTPAEMAGACAVTRFVDGDTVDVHERDDGFLPQAWKDDEGSTKC